ncbi:hypothetical protein TRFO_29420 [Tritrichomonas foetus]|uniref:Mediator of RNA polymerase II transcription subunit 9 n=1 Tax=Tritrichomonas foetus TaxID=1144522 RepID=A0A1J4JVR6_9EUKA|nr:hypothetical protein TRFO_29420 [Tritrichomonas foetus]|eukprot:OHT03233.1 hypothetical protein TRFO_29420 [Tritrichomonas foetus]
MSSRRGKKANPFEFIPIVRELLNLLVKPEATEKEISNVASQFVNKMDEAQKILANTPGLDMTEEEQEQKIADLQEAIRQKQHLIEECQRCFESWKDEQ